MSTLSARTDTTHQVSRRKLDPGFASRTTLHTACRVFPLLPGSPDCIRAMPDNFAAVTEGFAATFAEMLDRLWRSVCVRVCLVFDHAVGPLCLCCHAMGFLPCVGVCMSEPQVGSEVKLAEDI